MSEIGKVGIQWPREIPNELLYFPICSFFENNSGSCQFYIFCPTQAGKTLFEAFINRIFGKNHNMPIFIIVGFENIDNDILIMPVDTIFIDSLQNKVSFNLDRNFWKCCGGEGSDGIKNTFQYVKKLSYILEESQAGLLRFGNDVSIWDNMYSVWNWQTPANYFWKKYVEKYFKNSDKQPCFSFCLYGNSPKYIQGFIKNIPLIIKYFPTFSISLWIRSDSSNQENISMFLSKFTELGYDLDKFLIFEIQDPSHVCMMRYRIYMANHWYPSEVYSRDTDSRIGERDFQCISEFQASKKTFHIIRDHFWHKSRIMGGTCGVICGSQPFFPALFDEWASHNIVNNYATDEKFLQDSIYEKFKNNLYIHTNIVSYYDEDSHKISHEFQTKDCTDFIGNCYDENDVPQFKYWDFPIEQHTDWLIHQWGGHGGAERILLDFLSNMSLRARLLRNKNILSRITKSAVETGNLSRAKELFSEFEWIPTVDESTLRDLVVPYYNHAKKQFGITMIITTDTTRRPQDASEEIICVGNYPYGVWNLPNKERRICLPIMFYNLFESLDPRWEFDECWQNIDRIYILNLEERVDRWAATLAELASMGAPLNRIYHYKAKKAEIATKLEIYAGATKNHVDCVKNFVDSGLGCCLVLEDDFQFCSDISKNKVILAEFMKRKYNYDICMISYSKMGPIEPKDDLVFLSKQSCTTSSGYLLCRENAPKIHAVLDEGLRRMRETGDYSTYCCDRYWAKIQCHGKFLLLRNKIGFQRVVYSNITGCNNLFLD